MVINDSIQSLVALGFTGLEAEVYAFLLQESPATGYRVAQAIGKPAANTYKAIESLESKGAVIVDHGASRLCRAIPSEELLSQLERRFTENRARAANSLAALRGSPDDDRVYQLRSPEQVFERCRSMLARCQNVAVLDIFPMPLEELKPDIEAATARGIEVNVRVYEPAEVQGAHVILGSRGRDILERYPGQWIIMVTDGAEQLQAFMTQDGRGVHQAVWSGSAFLSWTLHGSVWCESVLAAMMHQIDNGASIEELRATAQAFRRTFRYDVPGYNALIERFGDRVAGASAGPVDRRGAGRRMGLAMVPWIQLPRPASLLHVARAAVAVAAVAPVAVGTARWCAARRSEPEMRSVTAQRVIPVSASPALSEEPTGERASIAEVVLSSRLRPSVP